MENISNENIRIGFDSRKEKIPVFKKLRAKIYDNCPLCIRARKNPDSRIGKILHHRYHSDHCPMWKAHKEVYVKEAS